MKALCLLFLLLQNCLSHKGKQLTITFVTALWFDESTSKDSVSNLQALQKFKQLIKIDFNMIIFGDQNLRKIVQNQRNLSSTVFVTKNYDEIQSLSSTQMVKQYLRKLKKEDPNEYEKYKKEAQLNSEFEASLMYAKISLLKEALSYDAFQTDYMYWLDADILTLPDYQIERLFYNEHNFIKQFTLNLQLPFIIRSGDNNNLFKFKQNGRQYAEDITTYAFSQWFGGRVQAITTFASIYQNILKISLQKRDYWKLQSVFTLMIHRYPKLITQINNLIPRGLYQLQIHPFRERRLQEKRHVIVSASNSTLKFKQRNHPQTPVFKTEYRSTQNFYEFQLLLTSAKFRSIRTQVFLSAIIFAYIAIKVGKKTFRLVKRKQMIQMQPL